jgi:hypothetical protein
MSAYKNKFPHSEIPNKHTPEQREVVYIITEMCGSEGILSEI